MLRYSDVFLYILWFPSLAGMKQIVTSHNFPIFLPAKGDLEIETIWIRVIVFSLNRNCPKHVNCITSQLPSTVITSFVYDKDVNTHS